MDLALNNLQRLICHKPHKPNQTKDEDNSPKNVNNIQNTSSQKYRQIILPHNNYLISSNYFYLISHPFAHSYITPGNS